MGWASGSSVFDEAAKPILESDIPDKQKVKFITALVKALDAQDWDTQSESRYWDNPIVRKVMKKLNPDWDWEDLENLDGSD